MLIAGCLASPGPFGGRTKSGPAFEACRQSIFKQADGNSDGVLDPAEAAADPMRLPYNFFERADENEVGVIDRQEYDELVMFVRCELCPQVTDCA